MALKSDRYELQTDISFFYNEGVATRGGVVVHDTAGSGAAMDQGVNLVKYAAVTAASRPVGILLNDVVNKDLTRTHLNQYKDEVQKGGKVTVLRKGYVVTNSITSASVSAGDPAYACHVNAGNLRIDSPGSSGVLQVGRFLSSKDEDGYAKVEVNLP
jgi:cAMP phosphodiesterase